MDKRFCYIIIIAIGCQGTEPPHVLVASYFLEFLSSDAYLHGIHMYIHYIYIYTNACT